jgi:hypothetical protein
MKNNIFVDNNIIKKESSIDKNKIFRNYQQKVSKATFKGHMKLDFERIIKYDFLK